MIVGAAAHDSEAVFLKSFSQNFRVLDNLRGVSFEFGLQRLAERDSLSRNDVHERAALNAGENRFVELFAELRVLAQNQAAARTS